MCLRLAAQLCLTLCNPRDYSPPGGFSRQEYWSGLPCCPPGDLPNPGMKPRSPALQVDSLPSESPGSPKILDIPSLLQGNFPTRNWAGVSCIAGGFLTSWATLKPCLLFLLIGIFYRGEFPIVCLYIFKLLIYIRLVDIYNITIYFAAQIPLALATGVHSSLFFCLSTWWFFIFEKFLIFWYYSHVPSLFCIFSAPVLDSITNLRNPGSFY